MKNGYQANKPMNRLHIELSEDHPAYQWANSQADRIGAKGHVGTHLDCYTAQPDFACREVEAYVYDAENAMPDSVAVAALPSLKGKALVLLTRNLQRNGYGCQDYFHTPTYLSSEVLDGILEKEPLLIIIDSHGIGRAGEEHQSFDKRCEARGCHVIENIDGTLLPGESWVHLHIEVDLSLASSGKPCKVYLLI